MGITGVEIDQHCVFFTEIVLLKVQACYKGYLKETRWWQFKASCLLFSSWGHNGYRELQNKQL